MKKKLMCGVLAALILVAYAPAVHAADPDPEKITTKYVLLMEANSGTVLFEKNADEHAGPASTTKIMTCILALENGDLDKKVTVPPVTERGSLMGIRRGEKMSLRSLIYGMMLVSGNDAAEAVAVHIGGSKEAFVSMMNKKAKELGMKNTNFAAPSGLHLEEHYTTARDFAILTRYALMESPKKGAFRAIIKRGAYTVNDSSSKTYELENTNKLIHTREKNGVKNESFEYRGAIGVKTGSTPGTLECLVAAAERGGVTLISVQFYEKDADYRFKLAKQLFDWGFENYASNSAEGLALPETIDIPVIGGEADKLTLRADLSGKMIYCLAAEFENIKNNAGAVTVSADIDKVNAPVVQGDRIATLTYSYEGKTLFTADGYAGSAVNEAGAQVVSGMMQPEVNEGGDGDGGLIVLPGRATPIGRTSPVLIILLAVFILLLLFVLTAVFYKARLMKRRRRRRRY